MRLDQNPGHDRSAATATAGLPAEPVARRAAVRPPAAGRRASRPQRPDTIGLHAPARDARAPGPPGPPAARVARRRPGNEGSDGRSGAAGPRPSLCRSTPRHAAQGPSAAPGPAERQRPGPPMAAGANRR